MIEVGPEVSPICLGDFNGRLKTLEPNIETDENGDMIEEWMSKFNLNHLNQTEDCIGTYTFETKMEKVPLTISSQMKNYLKDTKECI